MPIPKEGGRPFISVLPERRSSPKRGVALWQHYRMDIGKEKRVGLTNKTLTLMEANTSETPPGHP